MKDGQPNTAGAGRTDCAHCPLGKLDHFRRFDDDEQDYVEGFKTGELITETGATIIVDGAHNAHLYTLLSGWAFRYKIMEDGRRQILNYAVPGDLLGLQGSITGEMQHSVEALSPLTLCVFERDRVNELFSNHPDLAFDITWIAAREERILDEHLLSIGRRSAYERAAYLLAFLNRRGRLSGILTSKHNVIPITQQHVADTLGLSIVHTNKTLKKLKDRKLIAWGDGGCRVIDENQLAEIAGWEETEEKRRPFI
ncbi:Crp/Fnr family transcriptional regulator [Ahrensia marina]|uniref:Crp/Fnr family transcriptional regulator n=1 Tax=Ahrensia marina TaxID=1514904 RepID=A0A0N0E873_9HYPH|nr:Crp/Fnr family transcriptional regulator [Ahrensia marina]KPB02031.1 Crp/Fnr family transcriptional regulator [Ahrensia marina]